jgi:hypothetical protein
VRLAEIPQRGQYVCKIRVDKRESEVEKWTIIVYWDAENYSCVGREEGEERKDLVMWMFTPSVSELSDPVPDLSRGRSSYLVCYF